MEVLGREIDIEGLARSRFEANVRDRELAKKISDLLTQLNLHIRDTRGITTRVLDFSTKDKTFHFTIGKKNKISVTIEDSDKIFGGLINKFRTKTITLFEAVTTYIIQEGKTLVNGVYVNHKEEALLREAIGEIIDTLEEARTEYETQTYMDDLL